VLSWGRLRAKVQKTDTRSMRLTVLSHEPQSLVLFSHLTSSHLTTSVMTDTCLQCRPHRCATLPGVKFCTALAAAESIIALKVTVDECACSLSVSIGLLDVD